MYDHTLNPLLEGTTPYSLKDEWCKRIQNVNIAAARFTKSDFDADLLADEDWSALETLCPSIQNLEGFVFHLFQKSKEKGLDWMEEKVISTACLMSLKQKGLVMLEAYTQQVMPHIKPLAVQKFIKLHNEEGDTFTGYIDLVAIIKVNKDSPYDIPKEFETYDGAVVVFDNKTSSVKYKSDSVKTSAQLATYFEAVSKEYKPEYAGYIVIPKQIRKQKLPKVPIDVIVDRIDESLIASTFEEYNKNCALIKDGEFPRKLDSCQTKYGPCTYYQLCHHKSMAGLTCTKKEDE